MPKKKAEETLNLDAILFKCRDILRAARNSGSFFEKCDMMLTRVFLRFIGEKFEDGIEPWKQRIEDDFPDFKGTGTPEKFLHAKSQYLKWINWSIFLEVPDAPGAFHWYPDTPILSSCSKGHSKYKNMEQYADDIIDRSAKKLFMLDPIMAIADTAFRDKLDSQDPLYCSFSHSHTMDVSSDGVYLPITKKVCQIASITISGVMQWSLRTILPEYYVLKNAITREAFSGATIADSGERNGHMFAMIFPPKGRDINYHIFFSLRNSGKSYIA